MRYCLLVIENESETRQSLISAGIVLVKVPIRKMYGARAGLEKKELGVDRPCMQAQKSKPIALHAIAWHSKVLLLLFHGIDAVHGSWVTEGALHI